MLRLYSAGGSVEIQLNEPALTDAHWEELRRTSVAILKTRGFELAARILESWPFKVRRGTNGFGDEFVVLIAELPVSKYAAIGARMEEPSPQLAYSQIASVLSQVLSEYLRFIVVEIDRGREQVAEPEIRFTADVVHHALQDARVLIQNAGPQRAVDRVHTALHGYLRQICLDRSIDVPDDTSVTKLFKLVRSAPELVSLPEEVRKVLTSMAVVVDSMNALRNRSSLAHANPSLLGEAEAMLLINAVRTLLNYLETCFGASTS